MGDLLLSPHNDDAELFCCWNALRYKPHVIVCLRSYVQARHGVTHQERERETARAMNVLGCSWDQWSFRDDSPDWVGMEKALAMYDRRNGVERVFAPEPEKTGHEHHNGVADVALAVFGPERIRYYLTYTRDGGRSTDGAEVPFEPEWVPLKLLALACYESQMNPVLGCDTHFLGGLREYQP